MNLSSLSPTFTRFIVSLLALGTAILVGQLAVQIALHFGPDVRREETKIGYLFGFYYGLVLLVVVNLFTIKDSATALKRSLKIVLIANVIFAVALAIFTWVVANNTV